MTSWPGRAGRAREIYVSVAVAGVLPHDENVGPVDDDSFVVAQETERCGTAPVGDLNVAFEAGRRIGGARVPRFVLTSVAEVSPGDVHAAVRVDRHPGLELMRRGCVVVHADGFGPRVAAVL